jgi:hypothetical protein
MTSVLIRIRPPQENQSIKPAVEKVSDNTITVADLTVYSSPTVTEFRFHAIIGPSEPVPSLFRSMGGDVLILGYGHSGSGKTYTIFGPGGVLDSLTERIDFSSDQTSVSFLEVYNEKVFDLLSKSVNTPLSVFEDPRRRIVVRNLTTVDVGSPEELYAVVDVGMRNRIVSGNAVHSHSSRSHGILKVTSATRSFWLVDLAGSERIRLPTAAPRVTNLEINSIHKSLHALRRCIIGLRKKEFLPLRSSVLTRILFSSGISECVVIACISPDKESVPETLSTLDFANSALNSKHWLQSPKPQRTLSEIQLLRYALAKLRHELAIEKARRRKLEAEISRTMTPIIHHSGFAEGGTAGTIRKLNSSKLTNPSNCSSEADEDKTPPALLKIQNVDIIDRPTWAQDSVKLGCWESERSSFVADQPSDIEANCDDSVLSQTWRHNQYDAILQRSWQERVV